MDKVNVVVLSSIDEKFLKKIASVSPRIELIDASKIWNMPDLAEHVEIGNCNSEEYNAILAKAEVMYGYGFPPNVFERAPRLKWLQVLLAGVEHLLTDEIVRSRVKITNMSGVNAGPVCETALELMLMLAKQALLCIRIKRERKWERYVPILFRSQTVGIVGLGHIGGGIAKLTKAFGARVLAADLKFKKVTSTRWVDVAYPVEQLPTLLAESDFVVLALPYTRDTDKMIGEKELKAMKKTAYFVNVGRGKTVDEKALIRALEEGWIAGAGIDVMTAEPLPADSELWGLDNLYFSPHVAGRMPNYMEDATELFCENLRRYLDGKRLINLINKKKGF